MRGEVKEDEATCEVETRIPKTLSTALHFVQGREGKREQPHVGGCFEFCGSELCEVSYGSEL